MTKEEERLMKLEEKLEQERFMRLVDKRVQERNLHAIRLRPQLLTQEQLSKHVVALPDLSERAVGFDVGQPAIGLFDASALRQVRANFQRYTQSTNKRKKK